MDEDLRLLRAYLNREKANANIDENPDDEMHMQALLQILNEQGPQALSNAIGSDTVDEITGLENQAQSAMGKYGSLQDLGKILRQRNPFNRE